MARPETDGHAVGLWHAVIVVALDLPEVGVQRTAQRDIDFLNATTNAENW